MALQSGEMYSSGTNEPLKLGSTVWMKSWRDSIPSTKRRRRASNVSRGEEEMLFSHSITIDAPSVNSGKETGK